MTLNLGNYNNFLHQVQEDPSKALFSFSAKTLWKDGAKTETIARNRVIKADEPEAFGGQDSAVDPVELLLAALTSCVSNRGDSARSRAHLANVRQHPQRRGDQFLP